MGGSGLILLHLRGFPCKPVEASGVYSVMKVAGYRRRSSRL